MNFAVIDLIFIITGFSASFVMILFRLRDSSDPIIRENTDIMSTEYSYAEILLNTEIRRTKIIITHTVTA